MIEKFGQFSAFNEDNFILLRDKLNELVDAVNKGEPKCVAEPCPACKHWSPPIYDTANFCPACGRKIDKPTEQPDNLLSELRGALARAYCTDRNKHKVLDPYLIEDMVVEVKKALL